MSDVSRSGDGFTVEASLLAAAFRLAPAEVPDMLRTGAITSRCETGSGEDAGRWRLTFYSGGRALRLVVDASGTILSRASFPAHPPRAETDR